eukprot:2545501-Pleurochrysis_carterae.AAC.3
MALALLRASSSLAKRWRRFCVRRRVCRGGYALAPLLLRVAPAELVAQTTPQAPTQRLELLVQTLRTRHRPRH